MNYDQDDTINFKKATQGDRKALSSLYLKYYDRLTHYGIRINSNAYFVEESIQELFMYIAESGYRLGDIQNVKAYLFISLRRSLLKSLEVDRKHIARLSEYEYVRKTDISFSYIDLELSNGEDDSPINQINELLNGLPWRQKEAIYLRYYNNLSTKDIAEIMNIADQTVLNMLYQALKKIRALHKV